MGEITQFKTRQPEGALRFVSPGQDAAKGAFRKDFDPFRQKRSSTRWQRLRESVLSSSPLCVICGRPAIEAHHIIEAHVDPDLFFEQDNLVSVCEECHKKVHGAYRRGITPEMIFNKRINKPCQE